MDKKLADLIIRNAKVYTVDEANPQAEAVGVRGNGIVFVGTNDEVEKWVGAETRVVDGQGRTVMPGFIDSHFHLMFGALGLGDVQLYEADSLEKLRDAVQSYAADNPDLAWLKGVGMSYSVPNDAPLTRHHLDEIEGERPLTLMSFDVHTLWANTAALEKANLLNGVPNLSGGAEITMGEDGLATGALIEPAAYELMLAHVPQPDDNRRRELMRNGLAYLASLGVTSVHNMDGDAKQTAFYAAMEDAGELTLRVYMPYSVVPETPFEALATEAVAMREQFDSEMVKTGAVKFFMDGVFESYTAVSLNGYPDQPDNHGDPIFDVDHFAKMATEADRLGFQIFVHACGDGAVRRVLDGFETAQKANGKRDSRHRVEHIELIHPDDVPRFAELDVVASMQPLHAPLEENDPDLWPKRVRKEDWDMSFAWRTLQDAKALLAFGSDWPVVTPDPILGVWGAVARKPWEPGHNSHNQTLAETIAAYTRDGAYAEFQEDVKGQLKVGMLADLVLLTEDIFAVPADDIKDVRVAMTVVNGRVVYEKEAD